jgi:hypothetical protein
MDLDMRRNRPGMSKTIPERTALILTIRAIIAHLT